MAEIRIMGPQLSGKTTYLATLACLPNQSDLIQVTAIGDDSEGLVAQAKDIIRQGLDLERTDFNVEVDNIPLYQFKIDIKEKGFKNVSINLTTKDFGGEFFKSILDQPLSDNVSEYIEDCIKSSDGWMLMLTEFDESEDDFYKSVLDKLLMIADQNGKLDKKRIAVVMNKCERGEIWPCRIEPERDLFQVRLRQTRLLLRNRVPNNNLKFFAASSFGVLNKKDPRPNRWVTSKQKSVLRDSNAWSPYGIVNPIFWLETGKELKNASS